MGWSSGTAGSRSSGSGTRAHPSSDSLSCMFVLLHPHRPLSSSLSDCRRSLSACVTHHAGEHCDWPAGHTPTMRPGAHPWLCPHQGTGMKKNSPANRKKEPTQGLLWWASGWEPACQCRGSGFDPHRPRSSWAPRATTT